MRITSSAIGSIEGVDVAIKPDEVVYPSVAVFLAYRLGFPVSNIRVCRRRIGRAVGLNHTEIGSLIGLFMVPGMILALPAGFAGRFMSDRLIVGLGLIALAAGGGLAAVADSFNLLAAGRLISGIGFVFSTIFFTKIAADWFSGKELATAMGALVMFFCREAPEGAKTNSGFQFTLNRNEFC